MIFPSGRVPERPPDESAEEQRLAEAAWKF
jgi:hypothetical protein